MNKRQLAVAVVAALALSSSTIASAEGGSHRRMGEYDHITAVAPIALANTGGLLTLDTSTDVPSFHFDTTTVTPHIDFDTSTATLNFDDEPGSSGDGEDDALPAGNSVTHSEDSDGTHVAIPPAAPGTPPSAPSWITKPQAKSNNDNRDHSEQSSEESDD